MTMKLESFRSFWVKHYQDNTPLGWNFRRDMPQSCVRFHALPQSKQYPDNEMEKEIICYRANTLVNEILSSDSEFWLAVSRVEDCTDLVDKTNGPYTIQKHELSGSFIWTDTEEPIEEQVKWKTFSKKMAWEAVLCDDIFLKIADEEEFAVLLVNTLTADSLAPYPGGFDIIINDPKKLNEIKLNYTDWLPL